ncbi:MAG: ComF family protein [Candidatus Nucleicultricaceae bacterium]
MVGFGDFFEKVIHFIMPARCLMCADPLQSDYGLCQQCWAYFDFANPPLCCSCGCPLAMEMDEDLRCPFCLNDSEPWRQQRYVFTYGINSKALVLRFKHHDALHLAKTFGPWLARVSETFEATHDYIIPVPLYWTRLFKRQYNQSALLAEELSKIIKKPLVVDGLIKNRATPSQGVLSRYKRMKNVQNAFQVKESHQKKLQGSRVLLVDDVFTTGSTVRVCTEALLNAGVLAVDVLTLARVKKEQKQ